MKIKKAFTLAEVLVTLMIIGVIAAITIPTLKKISDERTYVTAAKKAYSAVSNATKNIKRNEGPVKTWAGSWTTMRDLYKKEMSMFDANTTSYKGSYLNGTSTIFRAEMRSADGFHYEFWGSSTCTDSRDGDYKNACVRIEVDTNGTNDPNMVGLDRVGFYVTSDGSVYPYGAGNGVTPTTCTKEGTGWGCTYRMITEGNISW